MSDRDSVSIRSCIEESIAHVTVSNLAVLDYWHVERVSTIGANQTEVDGRCCLQLNFQQLISNVGKLSVIGISRVAEVLTNEAVEVRASPSLLIFSTVREGSSY